ncbi:MAG: Lpg1974 family pore-forming outer membrane protein [Gemmatales bacterium]|nr:Lpg1974 family pore-forming outer membrane protein [Gemmatales bacterium]MDW8221346.1 Lpg1974 family pore-forming outer membrane protein [Gemmatales bacterium]
MSQGWKLWFLMGLLSLPTWLRGQVLPEPPPSSPVPPAPIKPDAVSRTEEKPASPPLPPVPEPARDLPPLPPGVSLPKPAPASEREVPVSKPSPLSISEEQPMPRKSPASADKPTNNQTLPPPTPLPGKPVVPEISPGVPDISGMPGGDDAYRPASWPPSVPAPVAPMPMPTPLPPVEHAGGPSGWVIFGDVMFWRPRLTEPLAIVTQVVAPGNTVSRIVPWDGDYELAFRAGAGYLFSGGVFVWGEYTHFDNLVTNTFLALPAAPPHFLIYNGPGLGHGATAGANDTATISWDLRYHTVDIMAGSVLSPTEFLDLTIAAGARLGQITHRINTSGTQGGGIVSGSDRWQLDIEGAGPRLGLESRLYLWRGHAGWSLSLYGRSYTSLLFADLDETTEAVQIVGGVVTQQARGFYSNRQVLPQLELALGGEWSLLGGRLIIAGGYEWIYWFDAASSSLSMLNSGTVQHQDLSFDGPYIRAILLW